MEKIAIVTVVTVVAVLAVIVAVVVVLGIVTPKKHRATVSMKLERAPTEVFAAIADLASWPSWNPAAKQVTRLADVNAHAAWKVVDGHGNAIPYEIVDKTAPSTNEAARFVTRIADESLPFGGTWTWTVAANGGGSDVTIVEDGVIKNVIFRALARTVFGYTTGQKKTLTALAARFGANDATVVEQWRHVDD